MWSFILVALVAGAFNPLQSAANAQLNRQLHAPVWAGIVVYATGLAGLLLTLLCLREAVPSAVAAGRVSPWAWCGGLISLVSTMGGLILAQRLGSGIWTGLTVTAATVISVLIDHLGALGFKQHNASVGRLIGCGLMIAGVWLVSVL